MVENARRVPENRDSLFDIAYPPPLREIERRLRGKAPVIGLGLSGGGIRSATFSLGVLQALARARRLGQIDCLSTVSGGGYTGAFLGRLFSRPYVRSTGDVEAILAGMATPRGEAAVEPSPGAPPDTEGDEVRRQAASKVIGWLRENGRYLAPRGAGDLLVGGAALLRNWMSVHITLGTLVLATLLALQLPRVAAADPVLRDWIPAWSRQLASAAVPDSRWIWWSPWLVPALGAGLAAVPLGWAYWLVPRERSPSARRGARGAWLGVIAAFAIGSGVLGAVWRGAEAGRALLASATVLAASALGAALVFALARAAAVQAARDLARTAAPGDAAEFVLFRDADIRRRLSVWLAGVLVVLAVSCVITAIDSLGQTMYYLAGRGELRSWALALAGVLFAFGAAARQLVVLVGPRVDGRRVSLPVSIAAGLVALAVATGLLVGYSVLAHAIAWQFGPAAGPALAAAPSITGSGPAGGPDEAGGAGFSMPGPRPERQGSSNVAGSVARQGDAPRETRGVPAGTPPAAARIPMRWFLVWLFGVAVLAVAGGQTFAFLNQSSHQPLYAARLTRAYLGASNPARWPSSGAQIPVTDVIAGDDIAVHEYWPPPSAGAGTPENRNGEDPYAKGAPLHFVNVTINETFDGQSQIQQQDRKGVGLALGPAGMSAGIRHHVLVTRVSGEGADAVEIAATFPEGDRFRVFEYGIPAGSGASRGFPWEPLSLGRWTSISGAAFTTGLGVRTSLGLSLLAGLMNVRLGYWWDSAARIEQRRQRVAERMSVLRVLSRVLPVQAYLLSELVGRFPGTSRRYWYLSDGGHFENLGGYELIRRRLPLIIVIDAESDPEYVFEGLANLVRKARLDFQTDIAFLDADALDRLAGQTALGAKRGNAGRWRSLFGSLDDLRPPLVRAGEQEGRLSRGLAKARCALALVRYPDDGGPVQQGVLVYVKPALRGDEPADIVEYARAHPPFPQQTTRDQFFDEAQWESYRKLGEIAGGDLAAALEMVAEPGFAGALARAVGAHGSSSRGTDESQTHRCGN